MMRRLSGFAQRRRAALSLCIVALLVQLTAAGIAGRSHHGVPAATQRVAVPDVVLSDAHGRGVALRALPGPAIILLVDDTAKSVKARDAWLRKLRAAESDVRLRKLLDPRLYVVQFGECNRSMASAMNVYCSVAPREALPFRLPARFVVSATGNVRGFAAGEANFGGDAPADDAHYLWSIARSTADIVLVDSKR